MAEGSKGEELTAHVYGLRRMLRARYHVQEWYLDHVEALALGFPGPVADLARDLIDTHRRHNEIFS